jgi:hypothetical protein
MKDPIDFYRDINQQQLYAIDKLYGLPEFVKKAEVEAPSEVAALPSQVYADTRRRIFPCHTKAATWLAQAYFCAAKPTYNTYEAALVQERITKSAEYWGIRGLIEGFRKSWAKLASEERGDISDADHALVVEWEGQKVRRMPMPNALSVKLAGEYLHANRAKYPYTWRKAAARKILARALHYDGLAAKGVKVAGMELGPTHFDPETQNYLERAAGFGVTHPAKVAEKLAARVIMLGKRHSAVREKLAMMAKAAAESDHLKPQALQKLAELVDLFDRETGLCNRYHEGVELPEEMFFDVLAKEAEAALESHVVLTTGNVYPLGVFLQVPLEKIAAALGNEFSNAVRSADGAIDPVKFAEVAPTLPRGDAMLLERALEAALNDPSTKEARPARMSKETFSKESLVEKFRREGHAVHPEQDYTLAIKL